MARPNKIWFRKDIGWWMVTPHAKLLSSGASSGERNPFVISFSAELIDPNGIKLSAPGF
jgi:hypothetical protein